MLILTSLLILIATHDKGSLGLSKLGGHSYEVVYITPDMGYIEGEYDILPLLDAMESLKALSQNIKAQCYLREIGLKEYQFEATKVSKWILEHVDSALLHTEDRPRLF